MASLSQIHWYEGLFIRPHHLQLMQHHLVERFGRERRLASPYPPGVIEAQVSKDALENSRVQFDSLRVIMPSGLEVDVPENDDLPPLDIKEAFLATSGSFMVYLAVPLWSANRGNTIDRSGQEDHRTKKIYGVSEIERPDENTGENLQPVQVRRTNARLLFEDDDRSDMEVLPLLRIARSTVEGADFPTLDRTYVPPCTVLRGSPILFELVRDLANQIEASRVSLVKRLKPGFTMEEIRGEKLRDMLKLRTISCYSPCLMQLIAAPVVSPFALYLELRSLLGELAAVHPDQDDPVVGDYDHEHLLRVFEELSGSIRGLLVGADIKKFKRVELSRSDRKEGNFVCKVSPEDFTQPVGYYLSIIDGGEESEVATLVTNANMFKLMPESKAFVGIPGIPLEEARVPPTSFPMRGQYFRLLPAKNQMVWDLIVKEGALSIFWRGMENSSMKISLYMEYP